jgi:hypothetical protein
LNVVVAEKYRSMRETAGIVVVTSSNHAPRDVSVVSTLLLLLSPEQEEFGRALPGCQLAEALFDLKAHGV